MSVEDTVKAHAKRLGELVPNSPGEDFFDWWERVEDSDDPEVHAIYVELEEIAYAHSLGRDDGITSIQLIDFYNATPEGVS